MEKKKISEIKRINFKYNSIDNNSILLPIKNFNNYICPDKTQNIIFIDFNQENLNFSNHLEFNDNINSLSRITLENKKYLFIAKSTINELYLIQDNNKFIKKENTSFECFEDKSIQQLVILDNKNIVSIIDSIKISFFNYKNSKYVKFFNNLNKDGIILGLLKLPNNKFCFLSYTFKGMAFILFNEDFSSKYKEIQKDPPIRIVKNNIMFKINKNEVMIIGKYEFFIFDINYFEICQIFKVGLICSILPFNNGKIRDIENIYNFFTIIFYENEKVYLKIFKYLKNVIKETEKINLIEYSAEFEALIDDNSILDYLKKEEENLNEDYQRNFFFDMAYDLKNNGNIILIINFIRSWGNKKLTILLEIDLNNLQFK